MRYPLNAELKRSVPMMDGARLSRMQDEMAEMVFDHGTGTYASRTHLYRLQKLSEAKANCFALYAPLVARWRLIIQDAPQVEALTCVVTYSAFARPSNPRGWTPPSGGRLSCRRLKLLAGQSCHLCMIGLAPVSVLRKGPVGWLLVICHCVMRAAETGLCTWYWRKTPLPSVLRNIGRGVGSRKFLTLRCLRKRSWGGASVRRVEVPLVC